MGVTEEGRALESIALPKRANGKPVYVLGENTFEGCKKIREVTIYDNLSLIEDGALKGLTSLEKLHLRREDAGNLEVGNGLFDGANENATICLYSETSYAHFMTGYFFSSYASKMKLITD